jgi:hypothetical protein
MIFFKKKKKTKTKEKRNGEITFYLSEVSTDFHFCFQSLKSDT